MGPPASGPPVPRRCSLPSGGPKARRPADHVAPTARTASLEKGKAPLVGEISGGSASRAAVMSPPPAEAVLRTAAKIPVKEETPTTGSGKTQTMLGDIERGTRRHSFNCGMTPQVFEYMFSRIQKGKESRRYEKLQFTC